VCLKELKMSSAHLRQCPGITLMLMDLLPTPVRCGAGGMENDQAAWEEATSYAGELFKDVNGKLTPGQEWRLVVSDADRHELCAIRVQVAEDEVREPTMVFDRRRGLNGHNRSTGGTG
jgi:cytosine/adenosine deaminase-related metal-dependent hydrolase